MGRIKGWRTVENDSYIVWSSQPQKTSLGDFYTNIEFVKPKKNEIGYFYITKRKITWIDGKYHSSTTIKDIFIGHPTTRKQGVEMARVYMRSHNE